MPVSIVIPTYLRERVLLETVCSLVALKHPADEILVVDQSGQHEASTSEALQNLVKRGQLRWLRLPQPSITKAMNTGLAQAQNEIVLFLDDDIVPGLQLISAHASVHTNGLSNIVAGQVLQPGEEVLPESPAGGEFLFRSGKRAWVRELMGGNFSVRKSTAVALGGFDENFVHVAYRFEAEFCDRALSVGEKILFEPAASIRHLKAGTGGTRAFGDHLTTVRPSHAVGAYYYLLRARTVEKRMLQIAIRPLRAIRTRHHLRSPWWIPLTMAAEIAGFFWAVVLFLRGRRLLEDRRSPTRGSSL